MTKIYLATHSDYDEYSIIDAFSDAVTANAYVDLVNKSTGARLDVDEFEVNDYVGGKFVFVHAYEVSMDYRAYTYKVKAVKSYTQVIPEGAAIPEDYLNHRFPDTPSAEGVCYSLDKAEAHAKAEVLRKEFNRQQTIWRKEQRRLSDEWEKKPLEERQAIIAERKRERENAK